MSNLLNQAKEYEKQSKKISNDIASSVNNELNRLEKYTKKRIAQSQENIENGLHLNESRYQKLLKESISNYEKTLKSAQVKTMLVFSIGLILGLSIAATAFILLTKYELIKLTIG